MQDLMVSTEDPIERARRAYASRSWVIARDAYEVARSSAPLGPDDLFALANCHWWLGDLAAALPLQREAYAGYLDLDAPSDAALAALDHAYTLSLRGDQAQASGWLGRVDRLLEGCPEGLVHGYLLHVGFEEAFDRPDLEEAMELALRVHALGERLEAGVLVALGLLGRGRVLLRRGEVTDGMRLLDQAMLGAVADDLDPGWSGNIYCHLMTACYEIGDIRRAGEWTEATARWCESMPGAGPFMGICRVHRAQVLQVRGDWEGAAREASRVTRELVDLDVPVVAEAHYLLGDVLRLRGRTTDAEAAFLEGHRLGRDPQPGLALLRLALGEIETAMSSIRAALVGVGDEPLERARLLPAAVEVALAAGEQEQAASWADELSAAAERYRTGGFRAAAVHARGALLLATGDAERAVPVLREALRAHRHLQARYDMARTRLLLADAYQELGDHEDAALERAAAERTLQVLMTPEPAGNDPGGLPGGLTPREAQVLGLAAAGRSNQEIAAALVLSVRTIERHLSTIYQKLGLEGRSARAGAVAFALREGMRSDT